MLLTLPLRVAVFPLSPDAYADSLTPLTFCYPNLQRPPYLEKQGHLPSAGRADGGHGG